MTPFLEQLEKNCAEFSERLALSLDNQKETVTYGELWNLSGKIYAYLKKLNIGTEDFVLINLPRGPKITVAVIGIWRAGAACTVTEEGYPAERVEYIRKDCNAKIVIDEKIYTEILAEDSLHGYEKTNPHDACYAVYTSGTTGNPKGALHEYGKLEVCVASYPKRPDFKYGENYRYAAAFPLNFVVYFMWTVPQLYFGNSFYILSYELIKNINAFSKFVADEKTTEFFMSPTLLKMYKNIPATLRLIVTGSDNVSDMYFPNVILKNGYGMSETAFFVSSFTVDKPYRRTPVGKNNYGLEIKILNEDGQSVKNGEHGEVCFENKYFRGYINLPEQTEKVFRGNIFHTGDLGYLDENGNLVIVGRKDDMIKIHGNRVEPTEIEIAVKDVLNVKNIIAKGFSDGSNAFIALYGLTSEIGDSFDEKNIPALREKLSKYLPQYMIPNYYIALEKFPTNANGKVSRKLFSPPEIKMDFGEYIAPVTETEKEICQKMAKILGVKKLSRNADFYQMGGDSLKTILLVTELIRFDINSADVYKYRTPEKLAAFCDNNNSNEKSTEKFSSFKAMEEKIFPVFQESYKNYLNNGVISSMYSSFFALNEKTIKKISLNPATEIILKEEVNPLRLQNAVNNALKICPYAAFDISKKGDIVYFHQNNLPLVVSKAGKIEEFGSESNNFHYIAVEYEKNKVIFTISHILTDGFGMNNFIQAVLNFYFDKKISYQDEKTFDFVADLMARELPLPKGYEPKNYSTPNHFILPEKNLTDSSDNIESYIEISAEKFDAFCQQYKISGQIAVSILLAEAIQTAHPDNADIISIRGPVNTRIPLYTPNTFQNSSIPHIFLNMDPNFLNDEISEEFLDKIKEDFADQYTYENLAAFTNKVREFFITDDSAKRSAIIADYKTKTDILANYMGKVLNDDISEYIKSYRQKISASYPLMLYALEYGKIIGLQIVQSFSSSVYVEGLRNVLVKRKMLL
ncbi:MAG: non-ribosomal peptide synthetase [Selenomonadaceae bacterium]|nr:non-ribosomal peptide synthetase [Selenomonadaceae bacterium]